MNDVRLLDCEQVAHLLDCCKRTVFRLVQSGKLPAPIKFNRKTVRWDEGTLRRWLFEKGATTVPEAGAAS